MDALIDSLNTTFDRGQQLSILQKIDALLWADGYGVPPYQFPAVTAFNDHVPSTIMCLQRSCAFNDHVTGVSPSPLSPNLPWNVWDWSPVGK